MLFYIFSGYLFYAAFEVAFRGGVLFYFSGKRYISWDLLNIRISMILSPGYWVAENCKISCSNDPEKELLLTKLIKNFNIINLLFSIALLIFVLAIRLEGFLIHEFLTAIVGWRYISRSVEIAVAFGRDIATPIRRTNLDNSDRMVLALRSYFEIFIYSAAFYTCVIKIWSGIGTPLLDTLYVGTFTNVSGVADSLNTFPHWVFVQVFATLSLVLLSIAGYLGKVKSN